VSSAQEPERKPVLASIAVVVCATKYLNCICHSASTRLNPSPTHGDPPSLPCSGTRDASTNIFFINLERQTTSSFYRSTTLPPSLQRGCIESECTSAEAATATLGIAYCCDAGTPCMPSLRCETTCLIQVDARPEAQSPHLDQRQRVFCKPTMMSNILIPPIGACIEQ
jgi:hypothetical protein